MHILLIRHGETDGNRLNRAVFGKQGAPLNENGESQAKALKEQLQAYGVEPELETAAVSELIRTHQTAKLAGFRKVTVYDSLNEIKTADPAHTLSLVEQRILPEEAKQAAKKILADPPKEKVWVTHGLVIVALLAELGLPEHTDFIPNPGEIVEIVIDTSRT